MTAKHFCTNKTHMSFFTALSLSLNNLMTKKGRTILTAFAGSIGIIGIALIMSLSNGVQEYIKRVEEDTLSSYPLTIQKTTIDTTSMMMTMMGENKDTSKYLLFFFTLEYKIPSFLNPKLINKFFDFLFSHIIFASILFTFKALKAKEITSLITSFAYPLF